MAKERGPVAAWVIMPFHDARFRIKRSDLLIKPVSVSKGRLLSSASTRKKRKPISCRRDQKEGIQTGRSLPTSSGGSLLGSQGFLLWPTGSISHLVSPREIQEWINQVSQCRSQGCKARKEGSHWHPLVQFNSSIIPVGKAASQQSGWDEQGRNESKEESGRLF